jgi:hypothetical protein
VSFQLKSPDQAGELSWNGIVFCAVDPGLGKVALTFHFLICQGIHFDSPPITATGVRP